MATLTKPVLVTPYALLAHGQSLLVELIVQEVFGTKNHTICVKVTLKGVMLEFIACFCRMLDPVGSVTRVHRNRIEWIVFFDIWDVTRCV